MFAFSTSIQNLWFVMPEVAMGWICPSADFWFTRCVFIHCYTFTWHADFRVTVSTRCVMVVRLS